MHAKTRLVTAMIAALWVNGASADGSGTGANSWIGYVFGGSLATGPNSAVTAGNSNIASGDGSFVGAGTANQANGASSLVIGGFDNRANAIDALVGAGAGHRAEGARSVIVGGGYNLAAGHFSFIGGGGRDGTSSAPAGSDMNRDNRAYGRWSVIGGGMGNEAGFSGFGDVFRSNVVVGGSRNTASGHHAFVGGGGCNAAVGDSSVIGGGGESSETIDCDFGSGNLAVGDHSVIAGGTANQATQLGSTVGGGGQNAATGIGSTVSGGSTNTASGFRSTVAGGGESTAIGSGSAVGGGSLNSATGTESAVAGGLGNIAGGGYSSVPGGYLNTATGDFSFAVGRQAKALAIGTIVFGDSTNADVTSNTPNQFVVAASGGIAMATNKNLSTGCFIPAGGGQWNCTSDRNVKRDFAPVAVQDILQKVAALPLSMWRYASEPSGALHIGPMAQDFRAAFGLGADDKHIGTVDADGVALAAIQGLHQLVQQTQATVREKDAQIAALTSEMVDLRRSVEMLLARSSLDAQLAQR